MCIRDRRYRKLERSRGLVTRLYLTTRYNNQLEQLWYGQLGPVSYTHLDVYKRQSLHRAEHLVY